MNRFPSVQNSTFSSHGDTTKSRTPFILQHAFRFLFILAFARFIDLVAESLPWCFSRSLSPSVTFTLWLLHKPVPKNIRGVSVCRTHPHSAHSVCVCHLGGLIVGSAYTNSSSMFFYSLEKNERVENTNMHVNRYTLHGPITHLYDKIWFLGWQMDV